MAGVLAGVECARRRRFHQSSDSGWFNSSSQTASVSTRRSSICLYISNHQSHLTTTSTPNLRRETNVDENLSKPAREAKERLDKKLKKSSATTKSVSNGKPEGKARVVALSEMDMLNCSNQ